MKLDGTAVVKGKKGQNVLVIDVDKAKLYQGDKGIYLDLFLYGNDEPDQYGNDYSISKSKSKEEREAKAETIFLGSAKKFGNGGSVSSDVQDATVINDVASDNLPF